MTLKRLVGITERGEYQRVLGRVLPFLLPEKPDRVIPIEAVPNCTTLSISQSNGLIDSRNNRHFQKGSAQIHVFENAVFWPSLSLCSIGDGVVKETFIHECKIATTLEKDICRKYPAIQVSGHATSIGHVHANYYHIYVDWIPRVYALRHPSLRNIERITLFIDERISDNQLQIIERLIPDNVVIRRVSKYCRIKVDYYIHLPYLSRDRSNYREKSTAIHQKTYSSAGFLPQEYVQFYRRNIFEFYGIKGEKPHRRIYISRRRASKRKLLNEDEVVSFLRTRGFQVFELENMTLQQQIKLFASASHIIAQHGAALTNLLYANHASVLEIFSSSHAPYHYSLLAESMGLDYSALHASGDTVHSNSQLSLSKLRRVIERWNL